MQSARALRFGLLDRPERPCGHVHAVRRDRIEMPHRDRGAVVDDEVGKDREIAVGIGDTRGARRAEPSHQLVAQRVDVGLGILAVDGNPFCDGPAAVIRIVGRQMAVAQVATKPARRQKLTLRRRDVDAGIAHVIQPRRVRRNQMVIVDAVLDQKLPVRPDVVFLGAGNDLHLSGRRLVDDEIDIVLGVAEIAVEIDRLAIEIGEVEIAVGLEPRHRHQAHFAFVERLAIGILARHRLEPAVGMIGPTVIHAVELPGIAFALAADQRAAVAAAIDQRAHGTFAVAAEDDRPPRHRAGLEVAGVFDLRGVADIGPAAVENGALFALENVVRDEHFAIDEERLRIRVLDDEIVA